MDRLSKIMAVVALAGLVARAAFADQFDSDGAKIHYFVAGTGEPVILIHGLHSSATLNWGLPGITETLAG